MISDEVWKEIIVGSVAVVSAALFSAVPAVVLVWWTWQRDQERLIVQKLLWYGNKLGGGHVMLGDGKIPNLDLLIRNRSLFEVHISAVGFEIDGNVYQMKHPYFPAKMKKNPNTASPYVTIVDDDFDVCELRSGDSVKVSIHDPQDRATLTAALMAAAQKYNCSATDLVNGSKVIAMVALETGKQFTSMSFRQLLWRRVLQIKREMDGLPPDADVED